MFKQSVARFATPASSLLAKRAASTHALSNAVVADLNGRWEELPSQDQQEIVSQLTERQKLNWKELTPAEKQATWYISYGEWGPRRPVHGKGDAGKILNGVLIGLGAALGIFLTIRANAPAAPKTLDRKWQEQSDEYLKSKNANPWSSYSQVQSK